ncbi:MAG: M56 family metallopeptidase, partial [Thermoguttaceae bacterium]
MILLSDDITEKFTPEEIKMILMHEMMHHKRLDPLVHFLAQLARAVHWFNPFAWVLLKKLATERELAVDESVMFHLGEETQAEYGSVVLKVVRNYNSAPDSPILLGFRNSDKFLERRIRMILTSKRRTISGVILGVILLAVFTVTGLTDSPTTKTLTVKSEPQITTVVVDENQMSVNQIAVEENKPYNHDYYKDGVSVSGVVLNEDGSPAVGAKIYLLPGIVIDLDADVEIVKPNVVTGPDGKFTTPK